MSEAASPLYGPDGRPTFFSDPAMDRFTSAFLNLASEVWVQNERIANLTAALTANGGAAADAVTTRDVEADAARDAELNSFLERVLGPLREGANVKAGHAETLLG